MTTDTPLGLCSSLNWVSSVHWAGKQSNTGLCLCAVVLAVRSTKRGCIEALDYGSTASNALSFHVMDSAREIVYAPPSPSWTKQRSIKIQHGMMY